jgi:hypothetical protein
MQERDAIFYQQLTQALTEPHLASLRKLMAVCEQRMKLAESKHIEQTGGYDFNASGDLPANFDFGAPKF